MISADLLMMKSELFLVKLTETGVNNTLIKLMKISPSFNIHIDMHTASFKLTVCMLGVDSSNDTR
jgi:hypothetical protein